MYFYEIRQKVFRKNRESKKMRGCNLKDSEFYSCVLIFTEFEDNCKTISPVFDISTSKIKRENMNKKNVIHLFEDL